ncbi:hypothetical protein DPMN_084641 [Dreissena polymorpha]|uniref:Uncharacterized protein n=1 Tax=Dreissena polymorpha TaxID=45954 RepID=A0A9D3YAX2_DREPO|nr:hypothetical protein DPMN_084641 [Dreissena polymorpha]
MCFGPTPRSSHWPDCNRYQEALLVKLRSAFPVSTIKEGVPQAWWRAVLEKYNEIREMVFNRQRVMQNTQIQLSNKNKPTLTAW